MCGHIAHVVPVGLCVQNDFWSELLEINILKDRSKYLHKISHNSSVAHIF